MNRKVYIYTLEFPEGEIRYVGKTINLKRRMSRHIYDSENRTSSRKLAWIRSILKSGNKPIMNILDEVTETESNFWEIYYIALIKSFGFRLTNNTFGGDGLSNPTLEVRKAISEKIKQRALISGVWNTGRKWTKEEKKNLSLGHKNREEVLQFDFYGNFIKKWDSRNQIKRELGYDNASIGKCCKGEYSFINGFVWIYEKDIDSIEERIERAKKSKKSKFVVL